MNTTSDPNELNAFMEFDHIILVSNGVAYHDVPDLYAPDVYVETDDDGSILGEHEADMIADLRSQGWEPMTGYSGQWSYSGPIMHPSEFIGGGLARDILANDGYYVAVVVMVSTDDGSEDAGWMVLRRDI